jgi:hypothetical protein
MILQADAYSGYTRLCKADRRLGADHRGGVWVLSMGAEVSAEVGT